MLILRSVAKQEQDMKPINSSECSYCGATSGTVTGLTLLMAADAPINIYTRYEYLMARGMDFRAYHPSFQRPRFISWLILFNGLILHPS